MRVLNKISDIVSEEMDAIGAQEIIMPILQPADLWHESGRWEAYGPELMRISDRHDADFCLGPTHEEIITALVRNELRSYKELPLALYDVRNLVENAHPQGKEGVQTRSHLANHARTQQKPMAGKLGV